MRLFLLLVIVPIIEIALFIEIGGWIGTWPTIGIVILTALIGSILLRRQGLAALRSVQGRLSAGESPGRLLADGAMILVAGALLLTPGFFTDAVGFALLVPQVRGALWDWLAPRLTVVQVRTTQAGPGRTRTGAQTVEGEYEEVDPSQEAEHPQEGPERR